MKEKNSMIGLLAALMTIFAAYFQLKDSQSFRTDVWQPIAEHTVGWSADDWNAVISNLIGWAAGVGMIFFVRHWGMIETRRSPLWYLGPVFLLITSACQSDKVIKLIAW
jgi:hypothetical protein